MGCGQSKIGNIYSKNKRNKNNSSSNNNKKNGESMRSASIEQKNGSTKSNRTNNNGAEVNRNEDNHNGSIDPKNQAKKKSGGPGSGPLLQQAEVSSSQLDFFKMLDEKIENGPDYDESLDATMKAERISDLMRRWELASMSCWPTSVADLDHLDDFDESTDLTTSITTGIGNSRGNLSPKYREGMRNIIGGRPESAPVLVRNANRTIDGLQEMNSPSPNMPRHVLESITQSPTRTTTENPATILALQANESTVRLSRNLQSRSEDDVGASECVSQQQQQAIYREQYLQQTGIIAVQPQYVGNALRKNPYVQQFQLSTGPSPPSSPPPPSQSQSHRNFAPPRKRDFNAAQMT